MQNARRESAKHDQPSGFDLSKDSMYDVRALASGRAQRHTDIGLVLQNAGRMAEATMHFVEASQISPSDPTVLFNLARVWSVQGRLGEAALLYRKVISLKDGSEGAHFGLALTLADLGQFVEAELHYMQVLKINPMHWHARIGLAMTMVEQGRLLEALEQAEFLLPCQHEEGFPHKIFGVLLAHAGCAEGARLCFEKHLQVNADDEDDTAILLASVGGMLPQRASDQQIVQLYASRADNWDEKPVAGYQGHVMVARSLCDLGAARATSIIDAGCGTGLVGEILRTKTDRLIGVDMSKDMLVHARQKNIYDELHCGDLLDYFECHPQSCEIITSAATFIHFGQLDAVFQAAAKCLRGNGLFAFTLFPNEDNPDGVDVGLLNGFAQGACFRHGIRYVSRTAEAHGFCVEVLRCETHEYARGLPVPGLAVALRLKSRTFGFFSL